MPVFSPLFFFTRWSWFSPSKGHRGSLQIHFLKKACSLEVRFFFSIVTLWSFVLWRKDGKTRHVMKKKRKAIQHATLGYTKKTQTNFTCTFTTMMMRQKNLLLLLSWEFSWPAKRLFFKMSHRESHRYFLSTSFPSFPFDLLPYGELKKNHKFPISQLWFVHYYPLTPTLLSTLFLSQRIFFMAFSSSRHGIQSK